MTKGNNSILIESCVTDFGAGAGRDLPPDELFELFVATMLTKTLAIDPADLEDGIVDGGKDGGIDAFLFLVDDQPVSSIEDIEITRNSVVDIVIIQSKREYGFKEDPIDKLLASFPLILRLDASIDELKQRFNNLVLDKIQLLGEIRRVAAKRSAKIRIRVAYATLSNELELSGVQKGKAEQVCSLARSQVNDAEVGFDFISSKELFQLYREIPPQEYVLKFKAQPQTITYGANARGHIGVVYLSDYVSFLRDPEGVIKDNLFESNVRHFQGENEVNKGIRQSVESDTEHDFWWLNNGVTIICDKAGSIGESLSLSNPQIVNGLQTSYTLARHYVATPDDRRAVLVKVIESDDKDTQDKVIAATNRQTQVNVESLKATEEFQRALEKLFELSGYYYERRKNFYKNLGMPTERIFSIKQVAQGVHAIRFKQPAVARARPTSLLKSQTNYSRIFNESISSTVYLNCVLLHRQITKFVKKIPDKDEKRLERNYLYHLSRILCSVIAETAYPSDEDLARIDPLSIDPALADRSLELLRLVRAEYLRKHPTMNNISAAKSNDFVDAIDLKLREEFGGGIADKE